MIGRVTISEDVGVWYGAVIRGDGFIKKQAVDFEKKFEGINASGHETPEERGFYGVTIGEKGGLLKG